MIFKKRINKTHMTNKKRKYQKPAMQVFELKNRQQLLVGSGTNGSRSPYGDPISDSWE